MTLNISLHVPDGIVLASDSLATQMHQTEQKMSVHTKCPKCGSESVEVAATLVQRPPPAAARV
jgi:hypothetical protein